jgi:two-component system chemotaxis response regulator CheB
MKPIRALVVEDSPTVRRRICAVLAADPEIEIAGEAADGARAIALCRECRPDVVTMDMMLPTMSGLAATEYIMAHCPTPILVVSSSDHRGELFKTYDALAAGAVDAIEKPNGGPLDAGWEARLVERVKLVSRIRVITHPRGRLGALGRAEAAPRTAPAAPALVAVGASTGGPGAVVELLRGIPPGFAAPILIVLHLGEAFGAAIADWLADQTGRRVVAAADGGSLAALRGCVAVAPAGRHLIVRRGRTWLSGEAERHSCRPSVDVLFETVAREFGPAAAAVLLTGMGRDGAAGLLAVRRAGGMTIAQDEASCVVYGMPRAAVELGAARAVLPLAEIGPALGRRFAEPGR